MSEEIRNALIEKTFLGNEDHGIPTCMLSTNANGTYQGFGGWDLRHYGIDMLLGIMRAVEVERWEDLRGRYCRVKSKNGLLIAIGHITKNQWYQPERTPLPAKEETKA